MGRLIDAELLKQCYTGKNSLGTNDNDSKADYASIRKMIDSQPTAYDVDKVAEILDKDAQMLYSMGNFSPVKAWENKYLIPVIKAGGSKSWVDILQEGAVKDE